MLGIPPRVDKLTNDITDCHLEVDKVIQREAIGDTWVYRSIKRKIYCEADINTGKCTLVNFKNELEGKINGDILKIETEQKDLGILVTPTLSWNVNASKRCQKSLSAFYSLKRNLSKNCPIAITLT